MSAGAVAVTSGPGRNAFGSAGDVGIENHVQDPLPRRKGLSGPPHRVGVSGRRRLQATAMTGAGGAHVAAGAAGRPRSDGAGAGGQGQGQSTLVTAGLCVWRAWQWLLAFVAGGWPRRLPTEVRLRAHGHAARRPVTGRGVTRAGHQTWATRAAAGAEPSARAVACVRARARRVPCGARPHGFSDELCGVCLRSRLLGTVQLPPAAPCFPPCPPLPPLGQVGAVKSERGLLRSPGGRKARGSPRSCGR